MSFDIDWDSSKLKRTFKILDKELAPDEEVEKAVVSRSSNNTLYHRSAIIATDRRVLMIEPKYIGISYNIVSYDWRDVIDCHLKKGIFSARVTVSPVPGHGPALVVGSLKKRDATEFHAYALERIEELETERSQQVFGRKQETPTSTSIDEDPGVKALARLKTLYDQGLITRSEYERKKQDLLDQLL